MRRLWILAAVVVMAGCSSAGDSADTTPAPAPTSTATASTTTTSSTTTSPPTTSSTTTSTTAPPTTTTTVDPATFADAGPYPVGVTTLTLPKGAAVEVWYPAGVPATGTVGYDVRNEVPPDVRAVLTADVPAGYSYPGTRDAPLADGRFPVVLFSHGYSGIRQQSSFLTSHLASWGMVVAAPEHASRDLTNVLAQTASGDAADAVDDILVTLDLLTGEAATPGGRFDAHLDLDRVAAVGHSAGGWTALTAAGDPRIDGYVSMASGGPRDGAPYPAKPSLFLAGAIDGVVPAATVSRPAFDTAPAPSWYVELGATGHNGFDDFCTFGGGTGIIGLAEASGLGPVLDAQPQLRALGEDGCVPPAAPVEQAFPVIRRSVTSFLRTLFGDDAQPSLRPDQLAGPDTVNVITAAH